jgi:hypothetical protein
MIAHRCRHAGVGVHRSLRRGRMRRGKSSNWQRVCVRLGNLRSETAEDPRTTSRMQVGRV